MISGTVLLVIVILFWFSDQGFNLVVTIHILQFEC